MGQQAASQSPLVSVIVPAYNAQEFIVEALKSALRQSYSNIEVLVVDDGSQDGTAALVESIAEQDARVKLFRGPNQGVAAARNLAINNACGAYIAPLDADDIWYPDKLQRQVDCLSGADAAVGLVYAWSVHIDERGQLTGACIASALEGDAYLPLVYSNFVGNASAPLIRRACIERVGGYSTWYRQQGAQGCEDRELYLRLAECYRFRVVPEFLIGYRQVEGSMSCNGAPMARAHALLLAGIRRRHPEIPGKVYRWSNSRSFWYLGQKCTRCGDHLRALGLLAKAVFCDPVLFCNRQLYALVVRNLSGLLSGPAEPAAAQAGAATRPGSAMSQPPDDGLGLADIERRRAARPRFWRRLNARRLSHLSQLRLPVVQRSQGTERGEVAPGQAAEESSWHRP